MRNALEMWRRKERWGVRAREQPCQTSFTSTPRRSGAASSALLERAEGSWIRPLPRAQASFRKEMVCQWWKGFLEYLKFLNSLIVMYWSTSGRK